MKSLKSLLIVAIFIVTCSTLLFSQDHKQMDHSKMDMKNESSKVDDIVRKGTIDYKAIDKNKDGKVFQDMMDWNVISDKPDKCPLCKMTLKEVTLEKAKKNLIESGFKVK